MYYLLCIVLKYMTYKYLLNITISNLCISVLTYLWHHFVRNIMMYVPIETCFEFLLWKFPINM